MKLSRRDLKYLFPRIEGDTRWGLTVLGVGSFDIPAKYPSYPPLAPVGYHYTWEEGRTIPEQYALVYIARGRGVFESEASGARKVAAGSAFVLFPGVWHRYRPARSTGWDEYWFLFKGEIMDRLAGEGVFTPQSPVIDVGLNDHLMGQYQRLLELAEMQPLGFREQLSTTALAILASGWAAAQQRELGDRNLEGAIRKARFMMIEHIDQPLEARKIARELHLSYTHFRRLFKRMTGYSPGQYLLHMRIVKAQELLRDTRLSIKQICFMLGFDSPYYFSRIFKAKIGRSPLQWRQG